jgi:hypothetical protein
VFCAIAIASLITIADGLAIVVALPSIASIIGTFQIQEPGPEAAI